MEYTHLGRTGLKVSRLCLGTMAFGKLADEAESFRIYEQKKFSRLFLFLC